MGTGERAGATGDQHGGTASAPLWRSHDYNLWWSGGAISRLGSNISTVCCPLLILYATGSGAQAGVVAACVNIGFLVAALPGGVVADRYSRRRILIVSSLVQFAAGATVVPAVLAHHVWVAQLAAVGLVQGLASGFFAAASHAIRLRVVRRDQIARATSAEEARESGAALIGPPLGGVLFSVARWLPFAADAVSFAAASAASALLRADLGPDTAASATHAGDAGDGTVGDGTMSDSTISDSTTGAAAVSGPRESPLHSLLSGLRFAVRDSLLRYVMVWAALVNVGAAGMALLLVILCRYRGADPSMVGAALSIEAACALAGALLTPRLLRLVSGRRAVLVASWAMVGASVLVGYAPWPWLVGAAAGCMAFMIGPVNVVLSSSAVKRIPDEMMGRIGVSTQMSMQALVWTAPLLAGMLYDSFSPTTATLAFSGLFAALALLCHGARALRTIDDPDIAPVG